MDPECNGCRQQSEGHLSWKTLICGDTAGWFYCDLYLKLPSVIFLRYENANDSVRERMQAQCICYRKRKRTWGGQTGIGQTADCLSFLFVCQSCLFLLVFLLSALGQNSCKLISCDTPNTIECISDCFMVSSGLHYQWYPSTHRERERERERRGRVRQGSMEQDRWCWIKKHTLLFWFSLWIKRNRKCGIGLRPFLSHCFSAYLSHS